MNVKFQLKASLDQLDLLCRSLEGLQGSLMCTDRQMFEIILVIEELAANMIHHGRASTMEVELAKDWDVLVITMRDDGAPFDPTAVPAVDIHQPLEQRSPGGLGIHLVLHYTDSIDYSRENKKNIVILKKTI